VSGDDTERNRTLHISWLADTTGRPPPAAGTKPAPGLRTTNRLTSLREVRYDPRVDRLVEEPVREYLELRSAQSIVNETAVTLQCGGTAT